MRGLGLGMSLLADLVVTVFAPPVYASTSGNWARVAGANGSTVYGSASLAYDGATGQLILFGGQGSSGSSDQTWLWSGRRWSRLSPPTSPPARSGAAMAFDAATGQLILNGGYQGGASTPLSDTWDWTGSTWVQLFPAHVPGAVDGAALAYDPATRQLVRFGGGVIYGGGVTNQTYVWDGTDWSNLAPANPPTPRWEASMGWDQATRQFVLFGGDDPPVGPLGGTWTWDGHRWTNLLPDNSPSPDSPPPRWAAALGSDSAGELILYGGQSGDGSTADTWSWEGERWARLSPASNPGPRYDAGAAYDPAVGELVVYGGYGTSSLYDTWAYSLPASSSGEAPKPSVTAPPSRPAPTTTSPSSPSSGSDDSIGRPTATPAAGATTSSSHHSAPATPASTTQPVVARNHGNKATQASRTASAAAVSASGNSRPRGSPSSDVPPLIGAVAAALVLGAAGLGYRAFRRKKITPPAP